jgi:glycosyltransferase involved in cell wall biosynthesis
MVAASKDAPTTVLGMAAQGPQGPSFRVRCLLPSGSLRSEGINLRALPLFTENEARAFADGSLVGRARLMYRSRTRLLSELDRVPDDVRTVVIHRQADLAPSLAAERRAISERRFIYDVDDAIWLPPKQTGGHPWSFLKAPRRRTEWLASRADEVVAGNEILADYLSAYSPSVTVVPSLVDPSHTEARHHKESERVVLGWIGSRTTAPYLRRLRPLLRKVADAVAPMRLELLVVGGEPMSVPGVAGWFMNWSEENERRALSHMDIGVMPLPDTPWTRGKCAYKALQYMSAGVPVVTDAVGITAKAVGDGGYALDRDADWTEALESLILSSDERARVGARGRARVEAEYSLERWAPVIARIWTEH